MVNGVLKRLRREEGITSVIVVISVFAFLGATMLSLDAGNLWSSRRNEITGTDAASLDAAMRFNNGSLDPCPGGDAGPGGQAETEATNVLVRNNARSLHNDTDTPAGWEVTLADPSLCGVASYVPGKVRFDGRLPSASFFSQVFGINNLSAISSSTAAWGYVTAIGDDLRPIPVCARSEAYQNWVQFWNGSHGRTPSIPQDSDITPDPDYYADGVSYPTSVPPGNSLDSI